MDRVYLIPESQLDTLTKVTEQLARRAARFNAKLPAGVSGLPAVELVQAETVDVVEPDGTCSRSVRVTLRTDATELPNHVMLAVIQHQRLPDGTFKNIVRTLPGLSLDPNDPQLARFWQAEPTCDYCRLVRRRNDTYVAMHRGTGAVKQYGSDCLADATGIIGAEIFMAYILDVEDYVAKAAAKAQQKAEAGRAAWQPFGAYVPTREILLHAAALIRARGFVPASKAREWGRIATWEEAVTNLRRTNLRGLEIPVAIHPEDETLVDGFLAWARLELQPATDFQRSAQNTVVTDTTAIRSVAFGIALLADYRRQHLAPAEVKPESVHQGTLNQWLPAPVELTVVWVREPDSYDYPRRGQRQPAWHKLQDAAGNIYIWNSYDGRVLQRGETVRMRAKVLRHDEYRGVKQTVIGWVSIEEPTAVPALAVA